MRVLDEEEGRPGRPETTEETEAVGEEVVLATLVVPRPTEPGTSQKFGTLRRVP